MFDVIKNLFRPDPTKYFIGYVPDEMKPSKNRAARRGNRNPQYVGSRKKRKIRGMKKC